MFYSRSMIIPKSGPGRSEEQLWYLHNTYNPSLEALFEFAPGPELYKRNIDDELRRLSAQELEMLFRGFNDATDQFQLLIATNPSPDDPTEAERVFTSRYVVEMVCKKVFRDQLEDIKRFNDTLRMEPTWAAAAAMFFEYGAHQFLRGGRTIQLFPLLGHFSNPDNKNFICDDYSATKDGKAAGPVSLGQLEEKFLNPDAETAGPATTTTAL